MLSVKELRTSCPSTMTLIGRTFRPAPTLIGVLSGCGCALPTGINTPVNGDSPRAWQASTALVEACGNRPADWPVLAAVVGRDAETVGVLLLDGSRFQFAMGPESPEDFDKDIESHLLARWERWRAFLYRIQLAERHSWIDDVEKVRVGLGPVSSTFVQMKKTEAFAIWRRACAASRRLGDLFPGVDLEALAQV